MGAGPGVLAWRTACFIRSVDENLPRRRSARLPLFAGQRAHLSCLDPHRAGLSRRGRWLDQLAPQFATPLIRETLALLLCLFAGALALYGYLRWLRNEKAMRLKEDLPYTRTLLLISVALAAVAAVVMVLVFYAG